MSTTTENRADALAPSPPGVLADSGAASAWKPSALQGMSLVIRRELGTYFRSRIGYVIAALILFIAGVLFNVHAVGSSAKYSTEVLSDFLYDTSGMTMIAALLISMRLIAEDRQSGALPLLTTSSLTDGQIILAKFLSGFIFLSFLVLITLYMPLLIFLNGKVSVGHIVAGYVGLFALGAAALAIGTFGSAIANSQLVAVIVSTVILVFLLLQWMLARQIEGGLSDVIAYLSLHDKHFQPFRNGTFSTKDLIFYLTVTVFFLVLARNSLEERRWRP